MPAEAGSSGQVGGSLPEVITQGNNPKANSQGGEGTKPRCDALLTKGNEGSLPERSAGNPPKLITLDRACYHELFFVRVKWVTASLMVVAAPDKSRTATTRRGHEPCGLVGALTAGSGRPAGAETRGQRP